MGKGPDDIASEIVDLRKESDVIVDELLRRAKPSNVARGMTTTVTDRVGSVVSEAERIANEATIAASRVADDMPDPIRRHPMASTFATVGVLAGLIGFAISWFSVTRKPTATDRAVWKVRDSRDRVGSTLRDYLDRVQGLRRNVRDVRVVTVREEPSMVKRLLWVGMASVMATLGSMLFKRMTASLWRTTMKEPPPEK